jgi:hypothetical protein
MDEQAEIVYKQEPMDRKMDGGEDFVRRVNWRDLKIRAA